MFTVLVAVEDATRQMEAGWETKADLFFLRRYDIFRNDKGAVKLPTIRWSCGDAGQPVYTILSASTVVGRVSIVKDYTRPGSFRLHTRMSCGHLPKPALPAASSNRAASTAT